MRLSLDTLLLLGKLGDRSAEETAVWLGTHLDAEAASVNAGCIGAGFPGCGFFGILVEPVLDAHLKLVREGRWHPNTGSHREWEMPGRWVREWDDRLERYRPVWAMEAT